MIYCNFMWFTGEGVRIHFCLTSIFAKVHALRVQIVFFDMRQAFAGKLSVTVNSKIQAESNGESLSYSCQFQYVQPNVLYEFTCLAHGGKTSPFSHTLSCINLPLVRQLVELCQMGLLYWHLKELDVSPDIKQSFHVQLHLQNFPPLVHAEARSTEMPLCWNVVYSRP